MTAVLPARQLDLLRGPRQRGKRPPPPSEFAVHCLVADTLRRWLMPEWRFFHPANGEQRETPAAARLKRMGVMPGVSDFILFGPPTASVYALELKRRGQRPTVSQTAFLDAVRQAGGQSAWVDNYDDAVAVLKGWGALPDRLEVIGGLVVVRRKGEGGE